MAKFSKKVMGKEIGDAAVYAPPHTMTGKPVKAAFNSRPDQSDASTVNMSVAGINRRPAPEAKTTVSSHVVTARQPKVQLLEARWHELHRTQ